MFIKELHIENFRGFKNKTIIEFQEGLTVLIVKKYWKNNNFESFRIIIFIWK